MRGLFLALIPNFLRLSMRSWSCVLVTHRLARPAERGLCSAREGVTKTIAGSLCSGCDTAGAQTWSGRAGKLLLAAHPLLREGKKPHWEFRALRERKMLLQVTGFLKYSCIILNSTCCVCCFLGPSQGISRECLCEKTNQKIPTKPHTLKTQPLLLQLARKIPAVEMFICINARTGMADSAAAALHCLKCFCANNFLCCCSLLAPLPAERGLK